MNAQQRFQAAANLFLKTREIPADQIDAFITDQCGSDEALRAQVRQLLAVRDDQDMFEALASRLRPLQDGLRVRLSGIGVHGGAAPLAPGEQPDPGEQPNALIGHYRLLERIGEGGFGQVWMAEQREPVVRKVALKIIKLGMDTKQVIARFEAERQALALMDHPHIAKVLDAGATETGRPFFVMELCAGDSITEYCDRHNLAIPERLNLLVQVCQAVQHAHQKGLIHRDIKPSNILVSMQDGQPHAKVIDFGIAKATASRLTDKTLFTEHNQFIGTPQYMSPEQAEGSLDIDTRTDVYSLGVLLYELLTGVTPFDPKKLRSAAHAELQRIIREVEPPKPSTRLSQNATTIASIAAHRHTEPRKLGTIIRGDLDWITLKAMEKNRARRYETPSALAMDILRHLRNEPVVAGQPGAAYRLRKFVRRNRAAVLAATLVAAALVVGIIGTSIESVRATRARVDADRNAEQARRAERQARDAERQARDAEAAALRERALALRQAYSANMLSASDALERGQIDTARHYLDVAPADLRGWEWRHLESRLDLSQRVHDLGVSRFLQLHAAPDGKSYVGVVAEDVPPTRWTIRRWDVESGQVLQTIPTRAGSSHGQLIEGGKQLVLQAGDDPSGGKCALEIWDLERGELQSSQPVPAWVTVAPDGARAAYLLQGRLHLLDIRTGAERVSPSSVLRPQPAQAPVMCFAPDGRRLALNSSLGEIRVIDLDQLQILSTFEAHDNSITTMEFSADSTKLLPGSLDGSVRITDVAQNPPVALTTFRGHSGLVWDARFSPDESLVASSGVDRTVRLWDARTGSARSIFQAPTEKTRTWLGNSDMRAAQLAFLPDGQTLLSAYGRGTVYFWDVRAPDAWILRGHHSYVYPVQVSPDGATIYSGGWDGFAGQPGCLRFWDAASGDEIAATGDADMYIRGATLTPDGLRLGIYRAGRSPQIEIIDTTTGATVTTIAESREEWQCNSIDSLAIDPTGRRVFWVNNCRGAAQIADTQSGVILQSKPVRGGSTDFSRVAWSPDGRTVAMCNTHEPTIDLLSADSLELVHNWPHNHTGGVNSVCFSPDSKHIVTSGTDGIARVWDVATGERVHDLVGHADSVLCAVYSPDGKRIATGGNDRNIRIWDAETFDPVARLGGHEEYVYSLAWRADSQMLVSGSGDHTLRIWGTQPVKDRLQARRERQAMVARVEPMVQRLFEELRDPHKVVEAVKADASLSERARQIALQAALRISLERQPAATSQPH